MKKIPDEIDNPIDNILISLSDKLCPFLYETGHTPNMITTYSLITGLLSCYFLYHHHISLFCIFYLLSYFFDCVDGHFARKYEMTSDIGDMYDHIKDISIVALIIYIVYRNCGKITITHITVFIVAFVMMSIHFSCQEMNCNDKFNGKNNSYLPSSAICGDKDNIIWTRFFGCGTFQLVFIVLVSSICGKCKV